ncbi:hypothetical protein HAHE_20880 [Haloferula helveola]|uniref:DUF4328 domain-containing protein n=1 Tax=Haloferula helveola TaxID=490095 RepID=A0ABM7REQ8_9BACT|nr:hypothetical protein HAHE_20880 [Haloferula helveola]
MHEPSLNPYDTPEHAPEESGADVSKLPPGPYGAYRDNRILVRWVIGTVLLYLAFNLFWAVVNLLYTYSVTASSSELFNRIVEIAERAAWVNIISFVLFGVWINRTGKNAWLFQQLKTRAKDPKLPKAESLSDTPGWAVGWYFIPIANLWKPFTAMRDFVRASVTVEPMPSYLLPFWWALWLLSSFGDTTTGDGFTALTAAWSADAVVVAVTCASGVNVGLAVIAIQLLRSVTRLQHDSAIYFASMPPEQLAARPKSALPIEGPHA